MNIIITGIGTDSLRKTINCAKEKLESKYSKVSVKLLDKLPQGSRLEEEYLHHTYQELPFLQKMDKWVNEGNTLADIIENVAKLCRLIMSNN